MIGRVKMQKDNNYFKIIIIPIALFYHSSSFAVNNFVNTPLHLQSRSVTTTNYYVKPNITFYIDDSGSMHIGANYVCNYRINTCKTKKTSLPPPSPSVDIKYYYCKEWNYGQWSTDKIPQYSIPIPPFSPNDPPEKIIDVDYRSCFSTKSRIQVVKEVLKKLVDTYRKDFYFSLQPLKNTLNELNKFYEK